MPETAIKTHGEVMLLPAMMQNVDCGIVSFLLYLFIFNETKETG